MKCSVKRVVRILLCISLAFCIVGCGNDKPKPVDENSEINEEGISMKLYINDVEIPVIWEDNDTVSELMGEVAKGSVTVKMSMYSDNEQVGSLGRSYTSNNKQMTTHNGDIVLYNNSNIVVFYGSNSWSYTRLGKMDLSENDVTALLSKGDIELRLEQ